MSYTPGPWIWRNKSGSLHQAGTDRTYGPTVLAPTYEYDSGVDTEVSSADAALIAAAPDLLDALQRLADEARSMGQHLVYNAPTIALSSAIDAARAAIAKAIPPPPYPFCRTPEQCAGKGYCTRDPACNN